MSSPAPAYDFDRPIDRRSVPGEKWGRYAGRDVLPLWVADMDFAAPPEVLDALRRRVEHGVFGYTDAWPELVEAVVEGIARDHGWRIHPDWLVWLPGVVTGFNVACQAVGEEGDSVFTATPVYPPFLTAPGHAGRRLVTHALERQHHHWVWDWERTEACLNGETRLFMLCNPHNPVGRVFSREELQQIATLAERYDLVICSDEIHCGLVLDEDKPHIPIATLDESVARRSITLMAPSKTWNIPGLYCSFAIIPDPALRRRYRRAMRGVVPHVNVLGMVAAEAAYRHGGPWRAALLDYLRGNREKLMHALQHRLSGILTAAPEATYLAWLDCRALGLDDPAAFFEAAGVGLSDGTAFGAPGYLRLNFGCPAATLETALSRMADALDRLED